MGDLELFVIAYLVGYEAGYQSREHQNDNDSHPNADLVPPKYDWVVNG